MISSKKESLMPTQLHGNHYPVVEITSGHRSISECFSKLTAHYSMWSVRETDHMFMVVQQLYSQRNTSREAERLFHCSLFVSSLFYLFLVSSGGFTDYQSFTMKRSSVSQEGAVDAKKRRVSYIAFLKWQRELACEYQTMSWRLNCSEYVRRLDQGKQRS